MRAKRHQPCAAAGENRVPQKFWNKKQNKYICSKRKNFQLKRFEIITLWALSLTFVAWAIRCACTEHTTCAHPPFGRLFSGCSSFNAVRVFFSLAQSSFVAVVFMNCICFARHPYESEFVIQRPSSMRNECNRTVATMKDALLVA